MVSSATTYIVILVQFSGRDDSWWDKYWIHIKLEILIIIVSIYSIHILLKNACNIIINKLLHYKYLALLTPNLILSKEHFLKDFKYYNVTNFWKIKDLRVIMRFFKGLDISCLKKKKNDVPFSQNIFSKLHLFKNILKFTTSSPTHL